MPSAMNDVFLFGVIALAALLAAVLIRRRMRRSRRSQPHVRIDLLNRE